MNIDLVDTSPMRDRVPLNKLRRREASKIIGVWIEPDGNKKKLIQVLQKSAVEWGTEVRKVNGSQQDIRETYLDNETLNGATNILLFNSSKITELRIVQTTGLFLLP